MQRAACAKLGPMADGALARLGRWLTLAMALALSLGSYPGGESGLSDVYVFAGEGLMCIKRRKGISGGVGVAMMAVLGMALSRYC